MTELDLEPLTKNEKAFLRQLMDAFPVLISYVSKDLVYRLNNKAYEVWFGLEHGELVGQKVADVLGAEVFDELSPRFEQVLRGDRVEFDALAPYKDGGERHIHATYVPYYGPSGSIDGFFALVEDLSEHLLAAELREAAGKLSVIFDQAVEAIITVDKHQKIQSFSKSAEVLFGYTENDAVGKNLDDLIPSVHRERHRTHVDSFLASADADRAMSFLAPFLGCERMARNFPPKPIFPVSRQKGSGWAPC